MKRAKRFSMWVMPALAVAGLVVLSGCGGGGRPDNALSPVVTQEDAGLIASITGTVESPTGNLNAREASAAAAGVTVTLSNNGKKVKDVTTDANGNFTISLGSGVRLSSLLLIAATSKAGGGETLRSFVTGETLTVGPASELVARKVIATGKSLGEFSVAELKAMMARAQNGYSSACGSGAAGSAGVEDCVEALTAALGADLDADIAKAAPDSHEGYVGSETCSNCHQEIAAKFEASGHPYKLRSVEQVLQDMKEGKTPYIDITKFAGAPINGSWENVSYVIGGYKWKARMVDKNGYIYTGSDAQQNLIDGSQSAYDSATAAGTKKYDCGACHTTGWVPDEDYATDGDLTDNQDGMAGMVGEFAAGGVQCEACHGPGSDHVNFRDDMTVNRSAELCGSCHNRTATPETVAGGGANKIPAKSGFIEHHEQWNEVQASGHKDMTCVSCHDPHSKAGQGIVRTCEECHGEQTVNLAQGLMAGVACTECHMTEAVKSAVADSALFKGDVKSHITNISTDPDFQMIASNAVTLDSEGQGHLGLAYACTKCHSDFSAGEMAESLVGSTYNGGEGWDHKTLNVAESSLEASYVGSAACETCHYAKYQSFIESGHPYKLRTAAQTQADIAAGLTADIPIENFAGAPISGSWDNVSYVIGGYKWKARMVDKNGYIYTAADAQYNLATEGQGAYDASVPVGTKKYDCGACHTTGWVADADYATDGDLSDNQDGMAGMIGTFEFGGIQCEACHGPASLHVSKGQGLTVDDSGDACGLCHNRTATPETVAAGGPLVIPASGSFIQHHEQWNENKAGPHEDIACSECHDPHKKASESVLKTCESCHAEQASALAAADFMNDVSCVDCHMTEAVKSAVADNATLNGDVKNHIVRISSDPDYAMISGSAVVLDEDEQAKVGLGYACLKCHSDRVASELAATLEDSLYDGGAGWDHQTLNNWDGSAR